MTLALRAVKKVHINAEIKTATVEALLTYLTTVLFDKVNKTDEKLDVEIENEIFVTLKPFKSNFQEQCVEQLRRTLKKLSQPTSSQLEYVFKVYQIALNNTSKTSGIIKSYLKFHEECLSEAITFKTCAILIKILETNNKILSNGKIQLENTSIDEFLCFLIDPRIKSSTLTIEEFCKFYGAVGETLFVIASVRQNYFKSRISQYFNVYKCFLDAIYFYKNNTLDELQPTEISLLLKLSLQLEK